MLDVSLSVLSDEKFLIFFLLKNQQELTGAFEVTTFMSHFMFI